MGYKSKKMKEISSFIAIFLLFNCCAVVDGVKEIPKDFALPHIQFPRIGYGTAGLGGRVYEMVTQALEFGVKMIDTAQASEWYDEENTGHAVIDYVSRTSDSEVVVVTKVHPRNYEKSKLVNSILQSQQRIGNSSSTPLKVVLLHSPRCWQGLCSQEEEQYTWQQAWRTLTELKKAGRILSVGVSNFDAALLRELLSITDTKVDVIQNWMDPFQQDRQVREIAADYDIAYMAYSSFGTQWLHRRKENPVFSNEILSRLAQKHGTTVGQVVLSWLLQEGCVIIPRSGSVAHMQENFQLLPREGKKSIAVFLDDDDMKSIKALDGSLGQLWS